MVGRRRRVRVHRLDPGLAPAVHPAEQRAILNLGGIDPAPQMADRTALGMRPKWDTDVPALAVRLGARDPQRHVTGGPLHVPAAQRDQHGKSISAVARTFNVHPATMYRVLQR